MKRQKDWDRHTDGQTKRQIEGLSYGPIDMLTYGQTDGHTDRQKDGRMETDGWIDGKKNKRKDYFLK